MSEPSTPASQEAAHGAPTRSRRAIRAAEREAEREALLTGQQPLLTRKELRRLREEAEALQAAIEAGEITLEQAKALQDPLADAPQIDVPPLHATGVHAAVAAPIATAAAQPEPAPAPAEVTAAASTPAEAASPLRAAEQPQAKDSAPAVHTAATSMPASPAHPQDARGLSEAEKEKIAEAATGLLGAVDIPDAIAPAAHPEPADPAKPSVPDRRSVLGGRTSHHSHAATFPPLTTPTPGEGVKATSAAASAINPSATASHTPVRKPIVRIPTAAQGVRTVDAHTGELSAVQVVDESFTGIETPTWKALREGVPAEGEGAAHSAKEGSDRPESQRLPWQLLGASAPSAISGSSAPSADSADPAAEEPEEPATHAWSNRLLLALIIVVVVLVVATLTWFYLGRNTANAATVGQGLGAWFPLTL